MRTPLAAALAIVALMGALPARAGHSQERQGFWIGFGLGYGSANANCGGCGSSDREGSVTGYFKLGGTLSQQVLLGVEGNAWTKEEGGGRVTLGNASLTLTFYPVATSGFFLKGGGGLSYVDTSFSGEGITVSASKTGWGLLGGLGYDIRIGRNVSLTPCVNYYYGKVGDVSFADFGDVLPGFHHDVIDFALGITFH